MSGQPADEEPSLESCCKVLQVPIGAGPKQVQEAFKARALWLQIILLKDSEQPSQKVGGQATPVSSPGLEEERKKYHEMSLHNLEQSWTAFFYWQMRFAQQDAKYADFVREQRFFLNRQISELLKIGAIRQVHTAPSADGSPGSPGGGKGVVWALPTYMERIEATRSKRWVLDYQDMDPDVWTFEDREMLDGLEEEWVSGLTSLPASDSTIITLLTVHSHDYHWPVPLPPGPLRRATAFLLFPHHANPRPAVYEWTGGVPKQMPGSRKLMLARLAALLRPSEGMKDPHTFCKIVAADQILVFSKSSLDHSKHVDMVLKALEGDKEVEGLKLNPTKSVFAGSVKTIGPVLAKTEAAVKESTKKQDPKYLGLGAYHNLLVELNTNTSRAIDFGDEDQNTNKAGSLPKTPNKKNVWRSRLLVVGTICLLTVIPPFSGINKPKTQRKKSKALSGVQSKPSSGSSVPPTPPKQAGLLPWKRS